MKLLLILFLHKLYAHINIFKYDNDLKYDSVHKYRMSHFNELKSVDSFDTLNKFYKGFERLEDVKSQNEERKQEKRSVLKNVSSLYYELIDIYKKECNRVFGSKEENWRKKYNHKNLKYLEYQADEEDKEEKDKTDEEDKVEEEEEEEEKILEWVKVDKNRFSFITSMVIRNENNGLSTTLENKRIALKNEKKLVQDIASGRIDSDEDKEM